MKVVIYWAARTALFFAVLVALWGVGWRHWSVALGAAVIAWVISYAMFGSMYDAAAQQMERSLGLFGERDGDDEAAEDGEAAPATAAKPVAKKAAGTKPAAKKPAAKKAAGTKPAAKKPAAKKAAGTKPAAKKPAAKSKR